MCYAFTSEVLDADISLHSTSLLCALGCHCFVCVCVPRVRWTACCMAPNGDNILVLGMQGGRRFLSVRRESHLAPRMLYTMLNMLALHLMPSTLPHKHQFAF